MIPLHTIRAKTWLFNPALIGRIIVTLMVPSLLVDSMTGWMTMYASSAFSPSQLYRSGMFLLMFLWLASFWQIGFLLMLGVLSAVFFMMTVHGISATSIASFGMDFRFNLSLFAHFIYFVFLYGYLRVIKNDARELKRFEMLIYRVIWFSFAVIAINIILGIFGIGYSTLESYVKEDEIGSGGGKGFFVAGNDLSSTFLLVASMLLIKIWAPQHLFKYHLLAVSMLFLAVMLLTKAVILGVLILMIGIPLCITSVTRGWRLKLRPLAPLLWGISLGAGVLGWLIFSDSAIVRRASYLYESSDILVAVTTGRSNFFAAALEVWNERFGFMDWFFGRGWDGAQAAIGQVLGYAKIVEIDYVDVLLMNGMIGLLLVIFIWVFYLCFAWFNRRYSRVALAVVFVDLLLLGLAGSSGHILYSAMNGMFVALLNILPLVVYEKAPRQFVQHV